MSVAEQIRRLKAQVEREKWELTLAQHIEAMRLPKPVRQYQFIPGRRFRADFAWPDLMLIVEVDGGIHTNGRHNRGTGFEKDRIRDGLALEAGWIVYRCTPDMVAKGMAVETIRKIIKRISA